MGFATLGIVISMFIVNGVIFPYMQKAGAESAIFRLAVLGLLLMVFLILVIRSNPEQAGAYPDNDRSISYEEVKKRNAVGEAHRLSSEWNSYGKCLKSPAVWIITLSTGLILLIQRGCMASMVPALMSFGHEQATAANLMMISGALALVCSLAGGMVDEKLGTRHAMTVCGIAGAAACILFAFFSSSAVVAEIALILLGYAGSAGNNYQPSFTAEIFGRYDFDVPYSLIICMSTALSSLGYVAISSIGTNHSFQAAYLVCCVLSIISIIMTVTYKGRYEGRKELDQEEIDKLYEKIMSKQA